jgi:hypothetical protein
MTKYIKRIKKDEPNLIKNYYQNVNFDFKS